jgi:hypothetical protein
MGLKRKIDLTPIWDKSPLKGLHRDIDRLPFYNYKKLVWKLTELNAHIIIGIKKRSFKEFHIDHKISIYYGFKNNILPWCIADVSNLRILDSKSNSIKSTNIFIDYSNMWIIE